jgi:RNA polymerase sigma-70 factor (ECF subfamily)
MMVITEQVGFQERAMAKSSEAAERFAALVNRQSRFVFGIAYALLRNPQDAEDVVQETFFKLYRTGAWESMLDERGFLARAAWRIAVDRIPRRRDEPSEMEPVSGALSPEDSAIEADWNAALHRLIDKLPEDLRQPLALSAVEEMNSRQIAEVMGIAEGTVRTRLMRARQLLKQKLTALREGRHER